MIQARYSLVAVTLATLIGVTANYRQESPIEEKRKYAIVSFVIDGDTLILRGVAPPIRLWGINAAEKREKGFYEAKKALIRMVYDVKVSYVEIDRDQYRRIVARVFLPDGREVNRIMIESGKASEYCLFSKGFYGRC